MDTGEWSLGSIPLDVVKWNFPIAGIPFHSFKFTLRNLNYRNPFVGAGKTGWEITKGVKIMAGVLKSLPFSAVFCHFAV